MGDNYKKEITERQKRERLGEERLNNQGCLMKIIEYNMSNDIVVEFQDKHKAKIKAKYSEFKKGEIRNPYRPNLVGGMTGNKYPVKVNGKTLKEYYTWYNIVKECAKDNQSTIFEEWLFYENFYEWLHKQENFEQWISNDKWNVNKDIISNNKIYSPDTCYLIPYNLKLLLEKLNIDTEDLPEYLIEKHKKFTVYKIKQVAREEFEKENITSECYDAIMRRLLE